MSLQLIAKQMEAKGRKGDSMLVHMTPGEVAGLQKLAETAGGSLTVNPETGLVEANFLKQMLPTLVGAGVGFMTMNPMLGAAAGAAVGGVQARGNNQDMLTGMLMGGLGGYGGATLGSGITAAGAPAATGMGAGAAGTTAAPAVASVPGAGASIMNPATAGTTVAPGVTLQGATVPASGIASAPVNFSDLTASERMDQAMRGFMNLGTKEGRDIAYKDIGGSEGLIRAAMFGMMPGANAAPTESAPQNIHPILSSKIDYRTPASRSMSASQSGKPRSTSVPIPTFRAAQGGLMSLAEEGRPSFFAPQVDDDDPFANMPVYRDLEAYEGPMPNYVYQGKNIYTRAPVRQPRQVRAPAPVIPVITPAPAPAPVQAPVVVQPVLETSDGGFDRYLDPFDRTIEPVGSQPPAPVIDRSTVRTPAPVTYIDPALRDLPVIDLSRPRELAPIEQGPTSETGFEGYGYDPGAGDVGGEGGHGVDGTATGGMGASSARAKGGSIYLASGGIASLARGGLKEGGFVVPADVVAFLGGGNSDNGAEKIERMFPNAMYIDGPDGGQEDTVKTSIEGKQPARVAHGEVYIPPQDVKRAGGAKVLYAMLDRVRVAATGSKKQIKPVSLERAMA